MGGVRWGVRGLPWNKSSVIGRKVSEVWQHVSQQLSGPIRRGDRIPNCSQREDTESSATGGRGGVSSVGGGVGEGGMHEMK